GLGGFRNSYFAFDGLIGRIEVHPFNHLILRIIFQSYFDIGLVIVFWLARRAKITLFNVVPMVIMDPLGIRRSVRRTDGGVPFVQTNAFNRVTVGVNRESELGTAVGIP